MDRLWILTGAAAAFTSLAPLLPGCKLEGERSGRDAASQRDLDALEKEPWGDPGAVIAEVGGRSLTRGEFYVRVLRRFGTYEILQRMIGDELFEQEAERRGVKVGGEELEEKLEEVFARLKPRYERDGIDLDLARQDVRRELRTQLLYAKVIRAMREVTDAEVEAAYRESYRYRRAVARHIAYSFRVEPGESQEDASRLKLEAWNRARKAADLIRQGEDFAALARAESDDEVTRDRGGDLGPVHEDFDMEPALKDAILSLEEGEVSEPIENPRGGYHVFQVTQVLAAESFAECKERIRADLEEREPTLEEAAQALAELRRRADVRILVPALEKTSDAR
jgi:parvulin-like peptidyl-prolyl isomerase